MVVPEAGTADPSQAPKLIGHLDLHSAERHAQYMKIGGAVTGIAVVLAVVCGLYFRNAWERENRPKLLSLKGQADAFVQAKQYEKAKGKYDELFGLLGDRAVTDEHLQAEIESARLAVTENTKKVETVLAARAELQRKRQDAEQQQEAFSRVSIAQTPSQPRGAMTYENYLKITDGMFYSEVEILLDNYEPKEQNRAGSLRTLLWEGSDGCMVVCTFNDDHLISKSQVGLR